jgi:hypothetical protein
MQELIEVAAWKRFVPELEAQRPRLGCGEKTGHEDAVEREGGR